MINLILLQIAISQASEQIKHLCNETESWTQAFVIIAVIVIINIIIAVVQYFLNIRVKDEELKINRHTMIAKIGIEREVKLYVSMIEINNYTRGNENDMHEHIQQLSSVIREDALYVRVTLQDIAKEMIDYYISILYDWRKKDYKYEDKMMLKYRKEFNG